MTDVKDLASPSDLGKTYFTPMQSPQDDRSVPVYLDREIRKIGEAINALSADTLSVADIKALIADGISKITFPDSGGGNYDGDVNVFPPGAFDELFDRIWENIINNPLYDFLFDPIDFEIIDSGNMNDALNRFIYDIFELNNRTFWQATAPVSTEEYKLRENDMWINSSMGNILFTWNGSGWFQASDQRIEEQGIIVDAIINMDNDLLTGTAFYQKIDSVTAFAGKSARIFYQNDEPTNPFPDGQEPNDEGVLVDIFYDLKAGDQWHDTDVNIAAEDVTGGAPAVYVFDGSGWVSATDARIIGNFAAISEIATAVADPKQAAAQVIKQIRVTADDGLDKGTAAIAELNSTYTDGTSAMAESIRYQQAEVVTPELGRLGSQIEEIDTTRIGVCKIDGQPSDQVNKDTCEAAGGVWQVGIQFASSVKQVSVYDGQGDHVTIEEQFLIHRNDVNAAAGDAATAQEAAEAAGGGAYTALAAAQVAQKDVDDVNNITIPPLLEFKEETIAQYTIKIENADKVTGFGLMNDGQTSAFIVQADQFAIADQTATSAASSSIIPFAVVDNVVYIDTAYIKNLNMTSGKISVGHVAHSYYIQDLSEYGLSGSTTSFTSSNFEVNRYLNSPTDRGTRPNGSTPVQNQNVAEYGRVLATVTGYVVSGGEFGGSGGGDFRCSLSLEVNHSGSWVPVRTIEGFGVTQGGGDKAPYALPFTFSYLQPNTGTNGTVRFRVKGSRIGETGTIREITWSAIGTFK